MAWPRRIYVATTTLGVYYTENFVDPSTQPIWTAVNTGLAATDCREFHLDPFDQANRQYVMINTGQKIYRRENGGSWTEILNPTIAGTVLEDCPLEDIAATISTVFTQTTMCREDCGHCIATVMSRAGIMLSSLCGRMIMAPHGVRIDAAAL